ncbi:uncharacterized protein LOC134813980 isoform X2 [Bolinopsis microptera]
MFCKIRGRVKLAESSFKLLKIGMMVAGAFSITWLPQVAMKIINHTQMERNQQVHTRLPNSVEFICFILSNSSPVLNCIIYIFAVKNIRKTIVSGYSQQMVHAVRKVSSIRRRVSESALMTNQRFQLKRTRTTNDIDNRVILPRVQEISLDDQVSMPLCNINNHEQRDAVDSTDVGIIQKQYSLDSV